MAPASFGRYAVIDTIGAGAMGVVYRAADPQLDRQVAIKTIRLDGVDAAVAQELAARFRTEALAVGRLQHPHIVTIFDVGVEGDTPYFVMELVRGQSLKARLDRSGRLPLAEAADALNQLLDALSFAHGKHIVHRDIKPANILFDAEGQLKLGDFGAARIVDSGDATLTQGYVIGTPRYMSPEQIQGRPLDHRSDLFSAAVVLYQMLSGLRPFDGGSDYVATHRLLSQEVPALDCDALGLPPAVNEVLRRALVKDAAGRFQSARAFRDAFEQACRPGGGPRAVAAAEPATGVQPLPAWPAGPTTATTAATPTSPRRPVSHDDAVYQEIELVYWKEVTTADDTESYADFLQRFPDGVYAALARRRLGRLGGDTGASTPGGAPMVPAADGSVTFVRPAVPAPAARPASRDPSTRRRTVTAALAVAAAAASGIAVVLHRASPPGAPATEEVVEKVLHAPAARADGRVDWWARHPRLEAAGAAATRPALLPLPRVAVLAPLPAPAPRPAAARTSVVAPPARRPAEPPLRKAPEAPAATTAQGEPDGVAASPPAQPAAATALPPPAPAHAPPSPPIAEPPAARLPAPAPAPATGSTPAPSPAPAPPPPAPERRRVVVPAW